LKSPARVTDWAPGQRKLKLTTLAGAVALDQFPDVTADLLTRASSRTSSRASDTAPMPGSDIDHSTMSHEGDVK